MNSRIIAGGLVALIVAAAAFWLLTSKPERAAEHEAVEHTESDEKKPGIELSAEQVAKSDIKVDTAGPGRIRESLALYGVIAPNAERMRDVAARYQGTIRSVAKKVGDTVKQGDTLATVESNESLQAYALQAPLSGIVTARNANPGEQTGEKVLFTVADLSGVWVELSLFPRDAAKVHVGQSVRVKSADAGVSGEGTVIYVAPLGTSANQTRLARVLLDNKNSQWAPGLYVSAEVTLSEVDVPITIENDAVQTLEEHDSIFVRTAKGFEARTLRLGRSDGEHTEVLEGLKAGEKYASENSFVLKAEMGKGKADED